MVSTLAGSGQAGFTDGQDTLATFNNPYGVAVDNNHNIYVADWLNNSIRKIDSNGYVRTLAGNGTTGYANGIGRAALFNQPAGIAVDKFGNIYVGDCKNYVIRNITPNGQVSTLAGSNEFGF